MKNILLTLLALLLVHICSAQCLTDTLVVNTGYNPLTGLAIPPGANGATPVPDPHWVVSYISPDVATDIALTPITGLIEVVPVNSADIIQNAGTWAVNPVGNPGNWISCLNSFTYWAETDTDVLYQELSRPFRMCFSDSIKFNLYIANDNYVSATSVDATPLSFSQPPGFLTSTYSTYTNFTQTVYLTAGTHTINFFVYNYPLLGNNPTGLDVYGTVSSATHSSSLVSESSSACLTYVCSVVTSACDSISMPDTVSVCIGDSAHITPTITGSDSILYAYWTPTVGVGSDSSVITSILPPASGWYYLHLADILPGSNLVVNGDFSLGDVGFTSAYTFVSGPGSLFPESVYAIDVDPYPDHPAAFSFGDHTTGTGYMMSINGASSPIDVWCETITVLPNTWYNFAAWAANWSSADVGAGIPLLQFQINGVLLGAIETLSVAPAIWVPFNASWYSGAATTANICIYDECTATGGNDFSLDDISFVQVCNALDSVYVNIALPDTTTVVKDTFLCTTGSITIGVAPGYTSYLWGTGATTDSIIITTSGTYWVNAMLGCSVQRDSFHATLQHPPVVNLGNDTSLCVGDAFNLTSTQPAGTVFLWSTGNTTNTINVTTTGTYWLSVTDSGCTGSDTLKATFHVIPIVILGNDTTLCAGQTLNLTSIQPITATYLWSTGSIINTISVTTTNTYWLAVTDTGCTGSDTIHVTFHSVPVVNLGNDTSLCAGDTLTLSTTNPVGSVFVWSTGSTTNTITVTTTGNYWVRVTDSACSTTDTLKAAFHVIPVVNLGNDTTLCAGQVLPLTSPQPITATYLWSTGGTTNTINVTTTNTYWLAVTDTGCTGSDTINVTFHSLPVVHAGNDTSFCVGDTMILSSVQPVGAVYLWSNGYTGDSITVTTTGTYWLAVTDSGCANTDTIHVVVSPNPIVNLGHDTAICMSAILQSSVSYTTGATYLWSTGSITDTIHIASSGNYWIEVTIAGCTAYDTVHVGVYMDSFIIFNRDTAICLGNVVQVLAANFDSGVTYQWIPTAGIAFNTMPDPLIAPDTSAMYVVTASSPGCPPVIDSFYIDVEPNPTLFIGNDRAVCQFDTLQLNAQVKPAWYTHYIYTWSPAQVLDNTNTPNVVFFSPTTTAVYLTVSTPAGCTAVDSVLITVHSGNFASISQDATICPHDSVQLIANGGAEYRWHPALYLSDSMSSQPWAHPVTTQVYSMIATSIYGCLDTLSVNITVQPNANIDIPDSVILYAGQTYQLDPLTNCVDFNWFPPAGLSSAKISNPIAAPEITTKYTVYGINEYGCKAIDSINIIIDLSTLIAIPNAFTPGNGPNGTLYILKLGEATLNYFRIFNRWGNKVFETNNMEQGWDGTYNGTPQPEDVYVYEIQAVTNSGTIVTKHGNITLLR